MLSGEYFPHFLHMQENVRALRKKCEINVLTAKKANERYVRFQQSRLYEIVKFRYLHAVRKLLNLAFFFAVYNEVKRDIPRGQNDLFLVRYSLSNYFIMRYLHRSGYKVLLEVHGLAHIEEQEYGQTYMPTLYYMVLAYLEKRMLGWADEITTGSESSKKSVTALGIKEGRIHVVPNAVALDKFNHVTHPDKIVEKYHLENKIVIGFVGSFARYHGLEILLEIGRNLHKRHKNIIFLLVGRNVHGSDNPAQKVLAEGLSHIFRFTGEVPHFSVPLFIAVMDIAIIPDFNVYGSPMKLFEYMAMRKAIVAPDAPPIREIIENGETGMLFERGNVAEAQKAIEKLIEHKELCHRLGQRAHKKVTELYTWEQRAEKIVGIAERMIAPV